MERYVVENKFSGRTPGTTLYLVEAKDKTGAVHEAESDQRYKLFLVHVLDTHDFVCPNHIFGFRLFLTCEYWVSSSLLPKTFHTLIAKVAHTPVGIPIKEFQLGHGSAKFTNAQKVAVLKREGSGEPAGFPCFCTCISSSSKCLGSIAHSPWLVLTKVQDQGQCHLVDP